MSIEILYRLAYSTDAEKFKLLNDSFNGPDTNSIQNIKEYLGNIDTERVFVAEYEGNLIGFCCGQVIKSVCYKACSFELTELYIDENNIKKIELLTGNCNFNAQRFYENLGYVKTTQVHYKKRISESNND